MKRLIEFMLLFCVAAFLLVIAIDMIQHATPVRQPEQCVTVHTYADGRTIKVCDAVAVERWSR